MKSRKGQDASSAATFIIVMAMIIVLFIILLPDSERTKLGISPSKPSSKLITDYDYDDEDEYQILSVAPGSLSAYEKKTYDIPLSSIRLFSKTEEDVISLAKSITVLKSLSTTKEQSLFFSLDDPSDIEKLFLFLFIQEGEGTLYIKLNGHTFFEGEISQDDIPIELPLVYLQGSNVLKFGLRGSGFSTSEYTIRDIKLKKEVKTYNKKAVRSFHLTSGEKAGAKKPIFSYTVNCVSSKEEGVLTITLNNRVLSTEYIVCDATEHRKSLRSDDLKAGSNTLTFEIDKGDYTIEDLKIEIQGTDTLYPSYNFKLSDRDYYDIRGGCDSGDYEDCLSGCYDDCRNDCEDAPNYEACRLDCFEDCRSDCYDDTCESDEILWLKMIFEDATKRKKATIYINDRAFNMDTTKQTYIRDISHYVVRGTNYIRLIPKSNFEVEKLKVYLKRKD